MRSLLWNETSSLSPFLSMKRTKNEATDETTKEKKETKGDDEGTRIVRKFTFWNLHHIRAEEDGIILKWILYIAWGHVLDSNGIGYGSVSGAWDCRNLLRRSVYLPSDAKLFTKKTAQ